VGPRPILDDAERRKFLPLPGLELDPSVIQPEASHYTDGAIPVPTHCNKHHLQVAILWVLNSINGARDWPVDVSHANYKRSQSLVTVLAYWVINIYFTSISCKYSPKLKFVNKNLVSSYAPVTLYDSIYHMS
jgi:hypothetical protein